MGKVRSKRGIELHRTKDGETVVYVRYEAGGVPRRERIGVSRMEPDGIGKLRDVTEIEARRILKLRRQEIREARLRHEVWLSPAEREAKACEAASEAARRAEAEASAEQTARRVLLFETASERFLEAVKASTDYHAAHKGYFARLGRAFTGRYLDEITRQDVHRYLCDRTRGEGVFADWPRKVGLRPAQTEVNGLSALYGFVVDVEGRDLVNPCARPRSRKYAQASLPVYRPKRRKIVPTEAELDAIFRAAGEATYLDARMPKEDRKRSQGTFAAAVAVCYYTAARPESELCQLRHRDIEIPDRENVRSITGEAVLGTVSFRETKTGVDRTMPLHPEAEAALRTILVDRPTPETGERSEAFAARLEAWRETPVFRGADGTAWDRHSYRKPWRTMLRSLTKTHPTLAGMVMRDLRTAANTAIRAAGTPAAIAAKILGHSAEMNFSYVEATDEASRRAVLSL